MMLIKMIFSCIFSFPQTSQIHLDQLTLSLLLQLLQLIFHPHNISFDVVGISTQCNVYFLLNHTLKTKWFPTRGSDPDNRVAM